MIGQSLGQGVEVPVTVVRGLTVFLMKLASPYLHQVRLVAHMELETCLSCF